MAYNVTVRKTDGTIVNTTTSAYGSARPNVDDYLRITSGAPTGVYTVRWVLWEVDAFTGGPKVTIGAALPGDPPPPVPT